MLYVNVIDIISFYNFKILPDSFLCETLRLCALVAEKNWPRSREGAKDDKFFKFIIFVQFEKQLFIHYQNHEAF
jgi:hypothetical protein